MGVGDTVIKLYAVNEYRNIARLAARGAGLSWGLAEDAGFAGEWLAVRGLPFFAAIISARARGGFCALDEETILQGVLTPSISGKMLCPFIAGALICDLSRARPLEWRLSQVATPLILAPFIARAAVVKQCVKIQWPGATIIIDGENAAVIQSDNIAAASGEVHISQTSPPPRESILPVAAQCAVAAKEWRQLQILAARTFVPATDESRLRGAGAAADKD